MMKYCDLFCEFAEFPEKLSDGSLSCRTFIGLYCKKLKRIVPKNGRCQLDQEKDNALQNPGRNKP
ncbi:MAG: hypothetical protein J7L22_02750 [Candidatus Marinimicrobia bacterium]|nr:hypothetical protein [Candidatus Neomarinimicrobiota bacterium]